MNQKGSTSDIMTGPKIGAGSTGAGALTRVQKLLYDENRDEVVEAPHTREPIKVQLCRGGAMQKLVQRQILVLAMLVIAFVAAAEDDCPSAAIVRDSATIGTPYGSFEVEVCVSADGDQIVYVFSLTNVDSCPLETLCLDPFASEDDVELESSNQWQPDITPCGWVWRGPFWAPIRAGETQEFVVRVSGSTVAERIVGEVRFSEHLDCGNADYDFHLLGAAEAGGSDPTSRSDSSVTAEITGKYLLAFAACDDQHECGGPRRKTTYLAESDNGANWTPVPGYEPQQGGVPDLIRRGNTLYLYFNAPSESLMVRRYRYDTGTWEVRTVVTLIDPANPSARAIETGSILDDRGRIVLFYRAGAWLTVSEGCEGPKNMLQIHSATEVEGSDGLVFRRDEGVRYSIEPGPEVQVADPDIFEGPDGYILYVQEPDFRTDLYRNLVVLSSTSLREEYQPVPNLPDGSLCQCGGGRRGGFYDEDSGTYWTYISDSTEERRREGGGN